MLISLEQIQLFKSLTTNLNTVKQLDPYILEAEEFDLRPFLGDDLYLDLVADFEASPSLETYLDLYNGTEYTYNGRTYRHEGIVPVLAYFTFARYAAMSGTHSTKHGFVTKQTDFSEPASEKTIARMIGQSKSAALVYQDRVRRYLNHHASTYPLWYGSSKRRKGQIRISAIGGNANKKFYDDDCCDDIQVVIQ